MHLSNHHCQALLCPEQSLRWIKYYSDVRNTEKAGKLELESNLNRVHQKRSFRSEVVNRVGSKRAETVFIFRACLPIMASPIKIER